MTSQTSPQESEATDLYRTAVQAIVYTYPLFEMLRMRSGTAPRRNALGKYADEDRGSTRRWVNTFAHSRHLLKAGQSRVVTPNYDTLYSSLWLDLSAGPQLLCVPDTHDRYYVLGFLDAYTNPFCHLGRRTTGTAAQRFLLAGPEWDGEVPQDTQLVRCPTDMAWVIGRILIDGPEDEAQVNALQDGFTLTPLDGKDPDGRNIDAWMHHSSPPDDVMEYLRIVHRGMRENPPPAEHRPLMEAFASLGLGPFASPEGPETLSADHRSELARAYADGLRKIAKGLDTPRHGSWSVPFILGETYGDDFLTRAATAHRYIGALCSAEAMYPMAYHDADGQRLDGSHRYRLRFEAGELPPVHCFWSITLYSTRDFMLVPNPLDRYAIGDRSQHLAYGPDGSLEILIQHDAPPVGQQENWLPAPADGFYLCLRAYQPGEDMLAGRYKVPDIQRIDATES